MKDSGCLLLVYGILNCYKIQTERSAPGYLMLWRYYSNQLCIGFLLFELCLFAFARYAYRVNAHRSANDPKKRDFHPGAIFLAPFTWPLFLAAYITIFIIKAILYGVFLILFTIALLVIRKPFPLKWLDKIATVIGNKLLEANTFLIRVFFGKPFENPQTT